MSKVSLSLPAWFGDHMVLQQQVRTRIYGNTSPSAQVTIRLERFPSGRLLSSMEAEYGLIFQEKDYAEADGFFEFKLPMFEGSYDKFRLTVESAGESLIFDDILFGEVWLATGSSNMSMPVECSDVAPLIKSLNNASGLRFFTQNEDGLKIGSKEYSYNPVGQIYGGRWYQAGEQAAILKLSAAAVAFAIDLQKSLNLPLAVFSLACPASYIHSWLPRAVIESDAIIKNHVREIRHYRDKSNWNALPAEEKAADRYLKSRAYTQKDKAAENLPFALHNQPGALFNHKLAPYTSLSLRGILWYQGEEDLQYPDYYMRALPALCQVFKEMFQSPLSGLSFVYSQMTPRLASDLDPARLAFFNEALAAIRRRLPLKAGLITNYDLPLSFRQGSGYYDSPNTPRAKFEIGRRMSRVAQGLAYHLDMPASAPECIGAERVGNKLLLTFDNAGKGIRLRAGETQLKGFTICSEDSPYVLAEAKELYQLRVIVWHDEVKNPRSCAYAFGNFNSEANLCGSTGMPLVPFRLDREIRPTETPRSWAYCDSLEAFKFPITDPRSPRMGGKAMPGIYPLWKLYSGRASFHLEANNKRRGNASIFIKYNKADEKPLSFGPVLDYASDYPPLDLHLWSELHLQIFNTEHRIKTLRLLLADVNDRETVSEPLEIKNVLSWQTLVFKLKDAPVDLMRLTRLEFLLLDKEAEGSIYIDQIEFKGLEWS
ncbi:MAG: hypothetical protein SPK23_04910 [Eubacteriales bacterium]|nr:hypothetical protein [Clostridiales bacterium]MDY5836440.1 hypothetical protein [Eubacteriales bacterium]